MRLSGLLARLEEHQAVIIQQDDKLKVRAPKPLPADFMAELRAHKPELFTYLERRRQAEKVADLVEKEGVCIFWSDVFAESVAFIRDESFRSSVPASIVVYTKDEIDTLWAGEGPSDSQLRLLHHAKKIAGAQVIGHGKDITNGSLPL